MSVENTAGEQDSSTKTNGAKGDHVNGVVNGYSEKHKSSSHKSSSRDKDRDHKHSSSKHSSSSSRDKDKHSSSKDKDRSHSHKSSTRDKDKERSDKDKERSDKDRHRSKDHKSSRDKDKEREKDKSKKESSGISSKDKDKEREKDKDRHKHKSSSKDKDRDGKHSSSSRDKDRHRDKDKERSKDKDKRSKDKERSREKSSKDTEKVSSKSNDESKLENVKAEIRDEDFVDAPKIENIKSENEDQKPNFNESQSSCDYSLSQFKDEPVSVIKEEEPEETIKEEEEESDGDVPLSGRLLHKRTSTAVRLSTSKRKVEESDSEDDKPITQRKKAKTDKKKDKKKSKKRPMLDEDSEDEKPKPKSKKKAIAPVKVEVKTEPTGSPTKRKKKVEEPQEVWKWWEEEKKDTGVKWNFLEHKGPVFAAPYERLPSNVKFYYDGKEMQLSDDTEEIACFYAKMLEHDYTQKKAFNDNFFKDWRKAMTEKEKSVITDLKKCDFKKMNSYFTAQSEKNKQRTKEEKLKIKLENEALIQEYGFCTIDGHKEKIGNFKIEPPGLFRGRGEHPKMGMVKKRVMPEHVLINCAKDSNIPKAPKGHKWKEVRHDNTVTWLASWTENVQGQVKYIMLNPSSKLKGEKDWQKYETARKLHKCINKIRDTYQNEWKAKEMKIRQRAVALYFIDKLALRAGNEKDEDQADTVGCCSLRVEHITLHKEKDGKEYVVEFDFLGKDSIRYHNEVPVERRVFKNLELFKENKKEGDDLFDRLNTTVMNEHLRELMDGLTAKVFRTYNASITLQNQLVELTDADASIPEKILAYNRANRAVAVLCNHQRAVPKSHDKSMTNLRDKMNQKRDQIDDLEIEVKDLSKAAKRGGSVKDKMIHEKKKKALDKLKDQLRRMEVQETDRDENKTIALGTSKLNYLDPRISVAWCKKYDVPLDKIYNKTQRDKFRWAIDMANEDYVF